MVRKKVDDRIRKLIENGVVTKHRSMFVIIGNKGKDQASTKQSVTIPFYKCILQTSPKRRPNVCHKALSNVTNRSTVTVGPLGNLTLVCVCVCVCV